MQVFKSFEDYIKRNNEDTTPESMFLEFQMVLEIHAKFEKYLKKENLNYKLEKMERSQRLLEKRKLFVDWFILQNQNKKMAKEIVIDLSEMLFVSTKTIRNTYFNGNYGQNSDK